MVLKILNRGRFWPVFLLLVASSLGWLVWKNRAALTIARASPVPAAYQASPPLPLPEGTTPTSWESEIAPSLRAALQNHVYGQMPSASRGQLTSRQPLAAPAGSRAEEIFVEAPFSAGEGPAMAVRFPVVLILPDGPGPHPVILVQSFCNNASAMPLEGISQTSSGMDCSGEGPVNSMMEYVFGRYIAVPPIEMILSRGYGLASFHSGEIVPDQREAGLARLNELAPTFAGEADRIGALAAWAWGTSRLVDILETDDRIDKDRIAVFGHSRYGKSALLSAAMDPRISAVIAHQSGAGGASLSKEKRGEQIGAITGTYPHWFAPAFSDFAGREEALPLDQHFLLALIAPRPLFLGSARRDVWSDPNAAFAAAQAASPVWEIYGEKGLRQQRLDEFDPAANIAFFMRPGTHGITEEDWPAFLDFLDAQMGRKSP